MPKLVGFVSHAFDDSLYAGGKAAFRSGITTLFERVEKALSDDTATVKIEPYFDASDYGRPLPAQLRRQLRESDFLVADISALDFSGRSIVNENVLYELGYAMALDLPVLLLRRHSSAPPPSDVRDILAASYNDPLEIPDLLEAPLAQSVARVLSAGEMRNSRGDARVVHTWFEPSVSAIHIICTPEPERSRFASQSDPNYLFVDNLEDRDALLEVATFLARQYPKAALIRHSSDSVPPDALTGNLVVLGGPGIEAGEGNQITRDIMKALNSTVRYRSDVDGIDFADTGPHLAKFRADESVESDWGCIVAAQNPMNPYARVVLCQGICTYGTLAAATILSDAPTAMSNHLLLHDADVFDVASGAPQFEAVFSVNVVANGRISTPKLKRELIRRLTPP